MVGGYVGSILHGCSDGWVESTVGCPHHSLVCTLCFAHEAPQFDDDNVLYFLRSGLSGITTRCCCVGGCRADIEGRAASWDSMSSGLDVDSVSCRGSVVASEPASSRPLDRALKHARCPPVASVVLDVSLCSSCGSRKARPLTELKNEKNKVQELNKM